MKMCAPMFLALAVTGIIPAAGLAVQPANRTEKTAPSSPVGVTRSATLQIRIASDNEEIFDYLSSSPKLAQWFPDKADIDPRVGGEYHYGWNGTEGVWSGEITDFLRDKTLCYTWRPPSDVSQTTVRFRLFPEGTSTLVELTHSGFTSTASLDRAVKAWTFYLENLKSVIEKGVDLRSAFRRQTASVSPQRNARRRTSP